MSVTTCRMSSQAYEDAVSGLATPLPPVDTNLCAALGEVLAVPVRAGTALPAFDNSAMDGYAVRCGDLRGNQASVPVVAEIAAGLQATGRLRSGHAAPITTGAPVPDGCDAVVPVEWTSRQGGMVVVERSPRPGQHIRRRGAELEPGEVVASAGQRLTARTVATLASVGVSRVIIRRPLRVAVLATGCELVAPGALRPEGGVFDANGPLLQALLQEDRVSADVLPALPDDPARVWVAIEGATADHDLVVTAGGISAGTHEVVRQALSGRGVRFTSVAMSPGSPQGHGKLDRSAVICLPGNPSAALVSYLVFVRPLLRLWQHGTSQPTSWISACTTTAVRRRPSTTGYLPAKLDVGQGHAQVTVAGDSHHLTSFARADAVMRVGPGDGDLRPGEVVDVLRL